MKRIIAIASLAGLLLTVPFVVFAAHQPRITADVKSTPGTELSSDEQIALSHAAVHILKQVNQAREALTEEDAKSAGEHVEKGLELVKIAEQALPASKVNTRIQAGDLSYQDEEDIKPQFVDIFDDLETVSVLGPARHAQQEIPRNAGTEAVTEVELRFASARLDLPLAREGLNEARDALREGKSAEVDQILETVQTYAVDFDIIESDLPLAKVSENLLLAEDLVKSGQRDEARAALQEANGALEQYGKLAGADRADDAKRMRSEIAALSSQLEKNGKGTGEQIKSWLNTIDGWLN